MQPLGHGVWPTHQVWEWFYDQPTSTVYHQAPDRGWRVFTPSMPRRHNHTRRHTLLYKVGHPCDAPTCLLLPATVYFAGTTDSFRVITGPNCIPSTEPQPDISPV